jgi:hypothetical protein
VWSHDELEALAAGYVLLALEPEEHRAFEAHLAICDRCAQRVAELRAVTGAMALLVEDREPPPQLKERILATARAERSAASAGRIPSASSEQAQRTGEGTAIGRQSQKARWPVFTWPAVAVAAMWLLLLAVAGLAFWVYQLQDSLEARERRVSRGYEAIAIMAQAQQWWRFKGTDAAPDAAGVVAFSSQHSAACLVIRGLPPAQGKSYHAWAIQDGVTTSIGAMWRLGEERWMIIPGNVDQLDTVMVTLEERRDPTEPTALVVARVPISNK